MKKTYISPACEIVKLNPSDIIATSLVNGFDGDFNTDGFGDGDMLSRGSDDWTVGGGDWEIFSE